MPTIGSSIKEGGIGFDYRLAMSIPDKVFKIINLINNTYIIFLFNCNIYIYLKNC